MTENATLLFTGTSDSISVVSRYTGTRGATWSVSAAGISATTSVVCCTFVDICITTNQRIIIWYIAIDIDEMLSYRREIALQGALVLATGARLEVQDDILTESPLRPFQ